MLSMRRCEIFIGEKHVCEWQYLSFALWVESHFRHNQTPYHKIMVTIPSASSNGLMFTCPVCFVVYSD